MRTATWAVILLHAGVAGCGVPDRPELDDLPPSGQPAADRGAFVRQQPWLVWGNILDHRQQQGARVPNGQLDRLVFDALPTLSLAGG